MTDCNFSYSLARATAEHVVESCPYVFLDLNLLEGKTMQINIVYVHCSPKIISIHNSFENDDGMTRPPVSTVFVSMRVVFLGLCF